MRSFTVHRRIRSIGDIDTEADGTLFLREGFAWLALLVPVLWLLYHRMWLVLLGFLVALGAVNVGLALIDAQGWAHGLAVGLIQLIFAGEAQNLRRWTLARNGYEFVGVILGRTRTEAETRYFRGWVRAILAHREAQAVGDDVRISFRQPEGGAVGELLPKDGTA